jgi:hypothetical protein
VGEPRSLAEVGVSHDQFESALPDLAKAAFSDPSIRTNPRIPLLREIVALLRAGQTGDAHPPDAPAVNTAKGARVNTAKGGRRGNRGSSS